MEIWPKLSGSAGRRIAKVQFNNMDLATDSGQTFTQNVYKYPMTTLGLLISGRSLIVSDLKLSAPFLKGDNPECQELIIIDSGSYNVQLTLLNITFRRPGF